MDYFKKIINKTLLRKIKHEGTDVVDYDNDALENALLYDYNLSNLVPINLWSYEELKTRKEELIHLAWKLYALYPKFYWDSGEQWNIADEMENIAQMYGIDIYGK